MSKVIALACVCCAPAAAAVHHVPGDFAGIQAALDAASDGDTVLVAAGEYVVEEPINFNRLHDPCDPASPPLKELTLAAEAGPEHTIIRRRASGGTPGFAVMFVAGESAASTFEGFTVTGGSGERGSGVYCVGSSPTIRACFITGNAAVYGGGLKCVTGAAPAVSECIILGNAADLGGGIFAGDGASPTVTDCVVTANSAELGGGLYCNDADALVRTCAFTNNAAARGGGIYAKMTAARIEACAAMGNVAVEEGGGVYATDSSLSLVNCLIGGNLSAGSGGGACSRGGDASRFTNCTVADNAAETGGALSAEGDSIPLAVNCIFWANGVDPLAAGYGSSIDVSYSCVEGEEARPGEGNIARDPLFVRRGDFDFTRFATLELDGVEYEIPDFMNDEGDYRLGAGSPCIDAGTAEGAPDADLAGRSRPSGGGFDMGAYEFEASEEVTFRRGDVNGDGDFNVSDPRTILMYLFLRTEISCLDAADVDDDGEVVVADALYELDYLFLDGPPLPPPVGECGSDPTPDALGCDRFGPCE